MIGTIHHHPSFASRYVEARNVDVWLPPGYSTNHPRRLPVLYFHDGQNLFDPRLSYAGVDWGLDQAVSQLIGEGKIPETIVVGIWNTPRRVREYMPARAAHLFAPQEYAEQFLDEIGGDLLSDEYLKFVVTELKPFIDLCYSTLRGPESTFIMGSSMGGLISLYAVCEYPQVFGGAGCVSTHWPIASGCMIDYMKQFLPSPETHRIYFDHGTYTLDGEYEPYQHLADQAMQDAGYTRDFNWMTRKFEGAEHSERAWRERVHIPLEFLLQP